MAGMRTALACLLLAIATPAAAQLRPLVAPPADAAVAARDGVDVFLINEGRDAAPIAAPEEIETIARDGTALKLSLIRSTAEGPGVPAGGFAKLRYRLAPLSEELVVNELPPSRPNEGEGEGSVTASRGVTNGAFDRFRPYEPIYIVAGAGSSRAKLQASFSFQPFDHGVLAPIRVAYTQTIFWAIGTPSGPITATIYRPEVFYEREFGDSMKIAVGYRHDSNGGGVADSVDLNRFYIRANQRFDLGGRWRLDIAPEAYGFFGPRGLARDVDRFFGFGGITASLLEEDGVKLSVQARGNPGTGRGAAELFASYPLRRLGGGLGLYLFGEAFTGYGEQLLRYNRIDNHVRFGVSLTR